MIFFYSQVLNTNLEDRLTTAAESFLSPCVTCLLSVLVMIYRNIRLLVFGGNLTSRLLFS